MQSPAQIVRAPLIFGESILAQRPIRILILAPVHRVWGNRVIREGKTLVRAGYEVAAIMKTDTPCERHGIRILPAPPYRNRIVRFLKIPIIFVQAFRQHADIYHSHNPDMIPVAFVLRLLGKTVIYDTHEDYRRRLNLRAWIPASIRPILSLTVGWAETSLSKFVQATFVTQPQMMAYFGDRTRLLRNAPKVNADHMQQIKSRSQTISRGAHYQIAYVGGVSHARGIMTMLAALEILNKTIPVRLWLAGQAMDDLLVQAQQHAGWQYVDYLGLLSHEDALAYAMRADIGLAVLKDVGDHCHARPTKLFEYMSVGTPFIATDFPQWRDVVATNEFGWWITPERPEILAQTVQDNIIDQGILDEHSLQGLNFVKGFNWECESKILLEVYDILSADIRRAAA